ncbi:Deoxyribodipyrimidine photo-lyase [Nereida ignava]|uniref:Deoxyribodipyrimidine photo-lyase n=1 Tax=Nereida ignava TaxID=282199 RepID=A0A0U1NME2_9RHOB|nr:FAD-binding domain-containing protein [Nereida ignava]CRK75905.1 Deoxyribodipyrimidine photo-lyase [Nereida ignava]SFJ76393.1 FAD binding domain of DNA photolyase [Nereida ignava DSM 16309]
MKTKDLIAELAARFEQPDFTPTRQAGLARLVAFSERAGDVYDRCRNYDLGPEYRANVSALSPWIRHRLITETEVLEVALRVHDFKKAERFVHEVFWRTYFKGWLEQHPTVWPAYQAGLRRQIKSLEKDRRLAAYYGEAIAGETGIDCFDAWAEELGTTGYLHNHARMWFASIWIFTLRLPWELGADFFLRHLIDGDPASNTLAWRWVAGIQTKGRPYIARVSNISKFTDRRFCPTHQIITNVTPIDDESDHLRKRLPDAVPPKDTPNEFLLLVTEDDMQIADALPHAPVATIGALATTGRSPLPIAELAQRFASGAMQDACGGAVIINQDAWANEIIEACERHQTKTVVTGYAPIGPSATALAEAQPNLTAAGIKLIQVRRSFDTIAWPHATKGFFAMKKAVPSVLEKLGITH